MRRRAENWVGGIKLRVGDRWKTSGAGKRLPQNSPGLRVVEKYPSTVVASGPFCNSGKSVSSVWVRQLPRGGTESNIAVIVR